MAAISGNLGEILRAQGNLTEALKYNRRALAVAEKALGPQHPGVAIAANNIGSTLQQQGDLPGALEYTQRALTILESAYGPAHPNTKTVAQNLTNIREEMK